MGWCCGCAAVRAECAKGAKSLRDWQATERLRAAGGAGSSRVLENDPANVAPDCDFHHFHARKPQSRASGKIRELGKRSREHAPARQRSGFVHEHRVLVAAIQDGGATCRVGLWRSCQRKPYCRGRWYWAAKPAMMMSRFLSKDCSLKRGKTRLVGLAGSASFARSSSDGWFSNDSANWNPRGTNA